MKRLLIIITCFTLITGCVYTSSYEVGKAFDEEKVSQIVKGKTTEAELLSMFGQPFAKSVISETDSKWVYSHSKGSASAQAFTMKTESNMNMSTLDILVRDGIVVNYAFTSGPVAPYVTSSVN
ncbi:hypothetical protein [Pragia fontium]|uniref:hypothetical protein n=1 Tax=Pragia fontium TaxID=82985 RepID=UPI00064B4AE6|nr:hypothetical protein [Pragia fontium]AKJ41806.1 hypothetical protein QQ39_06680 [Pragia fontium]